jgi:four helix bundle protein
VRAGTFEDLIAWQKARLLAKEIYTATRKGSLARDFAPASQMQRAAVSVMANIAEGFERGGRGEFHKFLVMAKGSSGELLSHLFVALDAGHFPLDEFKRLRTLAEEVGRVLGGLRASVARQRDEESNKR